jgi:hypothetical protein
MSKGDILKASDVRKEHPIYLMIAEGLSAIPQLTYVKIYNGRILASNQLCDNGKKEPLVDIGKEGIIGVELLVDEDNQVVQFYAITSSEKGCGETMLRSVVEKIPGDWHLAVVMDWSGGFWQVMTDRYPRLVVC